MPRHRAGNDRRPTASAPGPAWAGWTALSGLAGGFDEEFWLSALARSHGGDVAFLQVGAHDGIANDHLRPFATRLGWRGVLLEPVPAVFARLVHNCAGFPGLRPVNVALAEADGERPFWRVRDDRPGLPDWADQLGSFDRSVILGHSGLIPDLESLIVEERVRAVSFATLVREQKLKRIDLLAIDAEGYDARLLAEFDFARFRPRLVLFERRHLSAAHDQLATSVLAKAGYRRHDLAGFNAIAVPERD